MIESLAAHSKKYPLKATLATLKPVASLVAKYALLVLRFPVILIRLAAGFKKRVVRWVMGAPIESTQKKLAAQTYLWGSICDFYQTHQRKMMDFTHSDLDQIYGYPDFLQTIVDFLQSEQDERTRKVVVMTTIEAYFIVSDLEDRSTILSKLTTNIKNFEKKVSLQEYVQVCLKDVLAHALKQQSSALKADDFIDVDGDASPIQGRIDSYCKNLEENHTKFKQEVQNRNLFRFFRTNQRAKDTFNRLCNWVQFSDGSRFKKDEKFVAKLKKILQGFLKINIDTDFFNKHFQAIKTIIFMEPTKG